MSKYFINADQTHLCKHFITDHARGIMKLGISQRPHSLIAELLLPLKMVPISSAWRVQPLLGSWSSRKQSRCGRHSLSNILKLQATFLYLIYHQRAGYKANLFHMRGGRSRFNTYVPFERVEK